MAICVVAPYDLSFWRKCSGLCRKDFKNDDVWVWGGQIQAMEEMSTKWNSKNEGLYQEQKGYTLASSDWVWAQQQIIAVTEAEVKFDKRPDNFGGGHILIGGYSSSKGQEAPNVNKNSRPVTIFLIIMVQLSVTGNYGILWGGAEVNEI